MITIKKSNSDIDWCSACNKDKEEVKRTIYTFNVGSPSCTMEFHLCEKCLASLNKLQKKQTARQRNKA